MNIRYWLAGLVLAGVSAACGAQGAWSPQRNVEIVVGSAPGGSNDKTARQVEKILVEQKLLPTSLTVVNRTGAGGGIALNYLTQHPGDAHYLIVFTPSMITNHITGQSKLNYTDFTPVASLFNDYVVFAVNAASSIKTGKDLIERLKKDPQSVAIGFATALGSHNHIAAGILMKSIGGNPRALKAIAYKGSSEAITNLLGGHIDLVTTAAGNVAGHVEAGKLRVVGVAAPQRFPGALANIPTWKEQNVDVVFGGWRAIMGPKGMSAAQVAFWEGVLHKATQVPEWKDGILKNYWSDDFVTSAQFGKDIEKEYADMKAVLVDLGLAR
jgi:putative tricarboxylic transport membrane protein